MNGESNLYLSGGKGRDGLLISFATNTGSTDQGEREPEEAGSKKEETGSASSLRRRLVIITKESHHVMFLIYRG